MIQEKKVKTRDFWIKCAKNTYASTFFVHVGTGGGAEPTQGVDPRSSWLGRRRWLNKKVTSNPLKIGQRVAYRLALIATQGFRACQNSYGFRAN